MLIRKRQEFQSWIERLPRPFVKALTNPFVVSAVVGVGIWWLLAGRVIEFLPSPFQVAKAFVEAVTSGEFYFDMAITLRRVIIYGGAKSRDKRLVEMAAAYRFSRWQQLKEITLPELAPSLISGARFAFAIGWKLVVLFELLASNVGIGERLQFFFVFNQPARVIGWTLTFTVIM